MDRKLIQMVVDEMTSALKDRKLSVFHAEQIREWRNNICVATDTRIPS